MFENNKYERNCVSVNNDVRINNIFCISNPYDYDVKRFNMDKRLRLVTGNYNCQNLEENHKVYYF